MTSPITTHVLDTASGKPARNMPLTLERQDGGTWQPLATGVTDDDGRNRQLLDGQALTPGVYRLTFDTAAYFAATNTQGFYPSVPVIFEIREPDAHYHVPLLVSPYGFSTYRGS